MHPHVRQRSASRPQLRERWPTLEEGSFGGSDEAELGVERCDRVELPEACQSLEWLMSVSDGPPSPPDKSHARSLRRLRTGSPSTSRTSRPPARSVRSPRACAARQLPSPIHRKPGNVPLPSQVNHIRLDTTWDLDLDAHIDATERVERAERAAADLPPALGRRGAEEPAGNLLDVVGERVEVRGKRCGRGRVDTGDVVVAPELRGRGQRRVRGGAKRARTSFEPALPVVLMT